MPITWRNVEAPNLTDASRILSGAGNAFQAGISTLGDLLKGVQTTNDRNFEVQKANNTEAFLADLTSRYQTPEQYQAALASGEVNGTLAAAGPQIDKTAVRRFLDERLGTLTQRQTAQNAYQDQTTDRLMRPLLEQAKALAAKGDTAGLDTFMGANPGLARYVGDLTKAGVDGDRAKQEFGFKSSANTRADTKQEDDLLTSAAQRILMGKQGDAALANAGASKAAASLAALQARLAKEAADREGKAKDAAVSQGLYDGGALNTTAGTKALLEAMDKEKFTGAARRDVLFNLDKYFRDGITINTPDGKQRVPVPVSLAIRAVAASEENWAANAVPGWSRRGDDFTNILKSYLESPDIQRELASNYKQLKGKTVPTTIPDFLKPGTRPELPLPTGSNPKR